MKIIICIAIQLILFCSSVSAQNTHVNTPVPPQIQGPSAPNQPLLKPYNSAKPHSNSLNSKLDSGILGAYIIEKFFPAPEQKPMPESSVHINSKPYKLKNEK